MIVAIDPGAHGGIAHYADQALAYNMPESEGDLLESLRQYAGATVYLEDLVKFTGTNMPGSSMAKYASNWGFLKGALMALNCRIVLISPQKWQKALGLGTSKGLSKTEWKNKLKERAAQLYPECKVTLNTADALLILEYARSIERR